MERHDRRGFLSGLAGCITGFVIGGGPARAASDPPEAFADDPIARLFSPKPPPPPPHAGPTAPQHVAWVGEALAVIETVRPGITRAQLGAVFGRAGGAYASRTVAPLTGVYSYRECSYFKVEVEFQPVCKPTRNSLGDVWTPEDPADVVTKISRPYLEQVYYD